MRRSWRALVVSVLAQGIPLATPASEALAPAPTGFVLRGLELPPTLRPAPGPGPAPEAFGGATCAQIRERLDLPPDGSLCLSLGRAGGEVRLWNLSGAALSGPRPGDGPGVPPSLLGDARPGGPADPLEVRLADVSGLRLEGKYKKLAKDSLYLASFGVIVMGTMIVLPPSLSKWDTVDRGAFVSAMPGEWYGHVNKGPVVDHDKAAVNFIGHPISGAFYYQVARHDGFGVLGSTVYTAMMSAFFWEYGIEAFAEIPSVQDLIVTPLGGALLGEATYQLDQAVVRGGGTVLGSRFLGQTARVLLNPAGSLIDGLDGLLFGPTLPDGTPGRGLNARSSLVCYPARHPDRPDLKDDYCGLQVDISL